MLMVSPTNPDARLLPILPGFQAGEDIGVPSQPGLAGSEIRADEGEAYIPTLEGLTINKYAEAEFAVCHLALAAAHGKGCLTRIASAVDLFGGEREDEFAAESTGSDFAPGRRAPRDEVVAG